MIHDKRAIEDLKIVNEIRFGNPDAFHVMYDKYHKLVVFLAEQRGLNEKECNDVVREVFIRLWSAVHKFNEAKAPFIAWFAIYTRNIIISRLERNEEFITAKNKYNIDIAAHRNDIIKDSKNVTFNDIDEYLNEDESEILGYHLVFGASFETISQLTRHPLPTVKFIYRRAMSKLRDRGFALNYEGQET